MARSLKVYGWMGFYPVGVMEEAHKAGRVTHVRSLNCRYVMAAESKAAVYRATGKRAHDHYQVVETGNDAEVAVCLAQPGAVFYHDEVNYARAELIYVECAPEKSR